MIARSASLTFLCSTMVLMAAGEPGVLVELWHGVKGDNVSDLTQHPRYRKTAQAVRVLPQLSVSSIGDECGARFTALLAPPKTGQYTFWIAADDSAELWLSTDDRSANTVKIAEVPRYVGEEAWTALPSQESKPVQLTQGKAYYIMALHKDLGGADHAAVAWRGPGLDRQVIAGSYLTLPPMDGATQKLLSKAQALEKAFLSFSELNVDELSAFVASLGAADHKALAEKLSQKLTATKKGKEPGLLRKIATLAAGIDPSPDAPVTDAILKAVLGFEDVYLKALSVAELEALGPHRTSAAFGTINRDTPLIEKTVSVSSRADKDGREWVSTGLYAFPGKRVTVSVPNEWADKELTLRIGHHNPGGKGAFDCMPDTRRHATLDKGSIDAISPYGGLLFIDVPKEVEMDAVPVTFSGVIEAPRFILGKTTDEQWQSERQAPGPWGELVTDRVVIVAHSEALRELDDPTELMAWWHDAVSRHEGFYNHDRGMPFRLHVMHNARMGVSYWPLECSKGSASGILDARKLSAYSDGLFLHEHGHHADNGAMIFGNIGESTPNWGGYYMKGTGDDFAWKDTEETHMLALFDSGNSLHQEITEDTWWTKKYTHYWSYPCTSMMVGYAQGFGWEAFKTVVHRFTDSSDPVSRLEIFSNEATKKPWHRQTADDKKAVDQVKIDKWLIFLSEEAKCDVRPYFAHFALTPSSDVGKLVDGLGLPKWDLVYIPKRPVLVSKGQTVTIPSPVETALTHSGDLSLEWKAKAQRGEFTASSDGPVTYRASRWFKGTERIPYVLTNPLGNRFEGELVIHVLPDRENPHFAAGAIEDAPLDGWTRIRFPRTYRNPVVVATAVNSAEKAKAHLVVRIRGLGSKGCEASIVAPDGPPEEGKLTIVWSVMEEGTYTADTHGIEGVAATFQATPEGLSNDMGGVPECFEHDRAKLRASCFGQVMSADDGDWSEFYWSADPKLCGLRMGCQYGLEAAPRTPVTIGYMLLSKGLLQCGDTPVSVDRDITVGAHRLTLGNTNLKTVRRSRRNQMKFRDQYGRNSIIVGGWATTDGTLKTDFVPVDWAAEDAFIRPGEYDIILASDDRARNGLHIRSVAILRDGKRIASEAHDGLTTKASSKDNIYRVTLDEVDAAASYTIRAIARVDEVSGVYGSVIVRPTTDSMR